MLYLAPLHDGGLLVVRCVRGGVKDGHVTCVFKSRRKASSVTLLG